MEGVYVGDQVRCTIAGGCLMSKRFKWFEASGAVYLDVHFIYSLPVLAAVRHSRKSGNPGDAGHGDWMPAYAGMTFYWHRTYETDI
jgi:hypothetical protein